MGNSPGVAHATCPPVLAQQHERTGPAGGRAGRSVDELFGPSHIFAGRRELLGKLALRGIRMPISGHKRAPPSEQADVFIGDRIGPRARRLAGLSVCVQARCVKTAILAAAVVVGCGSSADGLTSASSGQPADGGVVADAGTPDAGTPGICPLSPHWVRDWALPVQGSPTLFFHSPQPGDLWLESFDDIHNYAP